MSRPSQLGYRDPFASAPPPQPSVQHAYGNHHYYDYDAGAPSPSPAPAAVQHRSYQAAARWRQPSLMMTDGYSQPYPYAPPPTTTSFDRVLDGIAQDLARDPLLSRLRGGSNEASPPSLYNYHTPYGNDDRLMPPTAAPPQQLPPYLLDHYQRNAGGRHAADATDWALRAAEGGAAGTVLDPWSGNPTQRHWELGDSQEGVGGVDGRPTPLLDTFGAGRGGGPGGTQPPTPSSSVQLQSLMSAPADELHKSDPHPRSPPPPPWLSTAAVREPAVPKVSRHREPLDQIVDPWAAWEQQGVDSSDPVEIPRTRNNTADAATPPLPTVTAARTSPRSSALKSPLNPKKRESPAQVTWPRDGAPPEMPSPGGGGTGNSSVRGESVTMEVSLGQYDAPIQLLLPSAVTDAARLATGTSMVSMPSVDFSLTDGLHSRRNSHMPRHGSREELTSSSSNRGVTTSPPTTTVGPTANATTTTTAPVAPAPAVKPTAAAIAAAAFGNPTTDRARQRKALLSLVKKAKEEEVAQQQNQAVSPPPPQSGATEHATAPVASTAGPSPPLAAPDQAPPPAASAGGSPTAVVVVVDAEAQDEVSRDQPRVKSTPIMAARRRRGSGFVMQALDPSSFVRDPFAVDGAGPLSCLQDGAHVQHFTYISVQGSTERPQLHGDHRNDGRARRECMEVNMHALPDDLTTLAADSKQGGSRRGLCVLIVIVAVLVVAGGVIAVLWWQNALKF